MKMEMSEAEFIEMMKLLQQNQNALPNFLEKGMDAIVKFLDMENKKMTSSCMTTCPPVFVGEVKKEELEEKEEIITPRKDVK